jgi:hypothetical protein
VAARQDYSVTVTTYTLSTITNVRRNPTKAKGCGGIFGEAVVALS